MLGSGGNAQQRDAADRFTAGFARCFAAADRGRCYDFPCQEWTATFLRLHDFFVLSASEKPEPVRSDG
jgi:hypothetical protein